MTLPELLSQNVSEIFEANGAGIEEELRTAEDGKLSISVPVKLTLVGARVYIVVGLSYARQFKDKLEANMELADPNQPELIEREPVSEKLEDVAAKLVTSLMENEGLSYKAALVQAKKIVAAQKAEIERKDDDDPPHIQCGPVEISTKPSKTKK